MADGASPNPWSVPTNNRHRYKGRRIGESQATETPQSQASAAPSSPAPPVGGVWGRLAATSDPKQLLTTPTATTASSTTVSKTGAWGGPKGAMELHYPYSISLESPNKKDSQVLDLDPRKLQRSPTKGVTSALGNLGVCGSSPRPRRTFADKALKGSSPIQVLANHFPVTINKATFPKAIYHYDVVIQSAEVGGNDPSKKSTLKREGKMGNGSSDPSTPPDRILPLIWLEFEKQFAGNLNAATPFDGKKNCYTAKRLSFEEQDGFSAMVEMKDPDDPDKDRQFRVTMKLVSTVQTANFWNFLRSGTSGISVDLPQDIIQALDVALRYAPSIALTPCNKSFFSGSDAQTLSNVLDLWYGHYQSLCLGCGESATLNIDLATKAFYKKMSVKDFLARQMNYDANDSFDLSVWDENSIQSASVLLKGKLIQYGSGRKTGTSFERYHRFTAVGLKQESSLTYKFTSNGQLMTIYDYMVNVRRTEVEHPNYPVVHIGSVGKTNFVPLELCSIIPQAYRGKMEPTLTSQMIKSAAVGPDERFKRIITARNSCNMESCKVLKEFGMNVGSTMQKITDGRRLHAPKIITRPQGKSDRADSTTFVDPNEGKWSFSGRNGSRQFVKGVEVPKFGVLVCARSNYLRGDSVEKFLNQLSRSGEDLGMKGFRSQTDEVIKKNCIKTVGALNRFPNGPLLPGFCKEVAIKLKAMKEDDVKFVIVIIGDEGKEYASVKAEAEVNVGILTACIKMKNVTIVKGQTIGNYLLKLNSKLNGTNFQVEHLREFFKEPTIIFGADVTHPAPNSTSPSIAAVTASYNNSGMGFNMHIQPQASKQEVIDNVGEIVEKMMMDFHDRTNRIPKKLIMFRDGVSEGFFNEIKAKEFEEIRKVCERMSPEEPIKITFVVVKKRHHTRLQPVNSREGVGKYYNVPPGTVVDTTIVHPAEQEFFLNSHVGIQGTSKPTRYHVIHDDTRYSMGDIQKMTYYLCYSFVRCTQPVSYPAATYYAHLAAYRARSLIEKDGETADLASLQKQLTIHPDLLRNYPMFFV